MNPIHRQTFCNDAFLYEERNESEASVSLIPGCIYAFEQAFSAIPPNLLFYWCNHYLTISRCEFSLLSMAVFDFSYLHSLSELTCDGFVADNFPPKDEIDVSEGVDNFETVGIVVDD